MGITERLDSQSLFVCFVCTVSTTERGELNDVHFGDSWRNYGECRQTDKSTPEGKSKPPLQTVAFTIMVLDGVYVSGNCNSMG